MSSNLFALPGGTWQAARPIGAQSRPTGKRKRTALPTSNVETDHAEEAGAASGTNQHLPNASRRPPILTPDDIYQHSIAGQPLDEERPAYDFPHSSGRPPRQTGNGEHHESHKKDPFTKAQATRVTLRQQHLAAITAVLHRSIVERDFNRAGRALGLIIRDEHNGYPTDIRTHGRWGIGAEILLRKGEPRHGAGSPVFTRSGFELARRYYERLAVEHPFVKNHQNAFDERDFNLALLGLWIFVAHEDGKRGRDTYNERDEGYGASSNVDMGAGVQNELVEARRIAQRMDDLMVSPLYRQNPEFMRLRAMVALWLADLSREIDELEADQGRENSMKPDENSVGDSTTIESTSDPDLYPGRPAVSRGRQRPNLEAMQSQAKAVALFTRLEARLRGSQTDDE